MCRHPDCVNHAAASSSLVPRPATLASAFMAKHTPSSIFWSILGIVASGLAGGIAGWVVITSLGWGGVVPARWSPR